MVMTDGYSQSIHRVQATDCLTVIILSPDIVLFAYYLFRTKYTPYVSCHALKPSKSEMTCFKGDVSAEAE